MKYWLKYPRPGEFRGRGIWREIDPNGPDWEGYKDCRATGYLPTHEGDEPPGPDDPAPDFGDKP